MIAGKIIPAIATTTAMITGAVMCELYKVVQGFNKIEDFRNAFINLAVSLFVFTEPSPAKPHEDEEMNVIMGGPVKAVPQKWTIWDTIILDRGSMTLQDLMDWLKETYKVDASMISVGTLALYNGYLPKGKHNERLPRKIEDVHAEVNPQGTIAGRNYICLDVGAALIECGTDVTMPRIKYIYGK